jgi:hypothetical protein
MDLPKILVVFVFLLIVFVFLFRSARFRNKYMMIGLIIVLILGAIFSDPIYQIIKNRVMNYVQSPDADRLPFISERWKNANSRNLKDNTSQRMSTDLLMNHKLTGYSRNDIVNLLGEPDSTHNFPEWDMEYYLGTSRRRNTWGSDWLVIKFDEKNLVIDYAISKK